MIGPDTQHPVTVMQDTIGLGLINGSTIRASDVRVMMAAEGVTPTTADKLRLGDVVYAIERAEPFTPAGVAVYFDVILRT